MAAMITTAVATLIPVFHFRVLRSAVCGRVVAVCGNAQQRIPGVGHRFAKVSHTRNGRSVLDRGPLRRQVHRRAADAGDPGQRALDVVDAGRARHAADVQRHLLGGLALAITVVRHFAPAHAVTESDTSIAPGARLNESHHNGAACSDTRAGTPL